MDREKLAEYLKAHDVKFKEMDPRPSFAAYLRPNRRGQNQVDPRLRRHRERQEIPLQRGRQNPKALDLLK